MFLEKKLAISVSEEQFRKFCPFSVITENHPLYAYSCYVATPHMYVHTYIHTYIPYSDLRAYFCTLTSMY